jgi:hypothetical protein
LRIVGTGARYTPEETIGAMFPANLTADAGLTAPNPNAILCVDYTVIYGIDEGNKKTLLTSQQSIVLCFCCTIINIDNSDA